ncbi:reverse transcriptase domain-containing protein [Artemisia annua]|uniref:Reverse transcriptase domain-containing protein n=1 Tax=Artemisia annua TaxID=35608 RepID=A0A2U1KRI0_ARTAN|nr:reverse transcriptase domain-containing protein [Artemisia annua]
MGESKSGMNGCFKCRDPSHISKNCTKPLVICYGCNEEGHKLSECPKVNPKQAKPFNIVKEEKVVVSKPKARVYQVGIEEAKSGSDVITGVILVKSKPARVLYDSGASMSFQFYSFSKELSIPLEKLPTPVEVEITDSKIVVVSNVYRNVEIEIDESIFRIDLIPIMLEDFDIIVGVDWLDKYNAAILCRQKIIRVVNPSGREMMIYSDKKDG